MKKPYFWKQTDSRWSRHSWRGVTIGTAGCGPTAVSCVVSALIKEVTPKEVFDWICKNGYMTTNSGTYWSGITAALKHYGVDKFKVTSDTKTAKKELKAGKWLIAVVGKSRWTRGGHYITAYALSGNRVLVSDPASSSDYRQKDGTWNEFANAEKMMWISIDPNDYKKSGNKSKTSKKVIMYVSDSKANIRKGRSTKYGVVDTVKRGTKLTLTSYKNGWYKIASGKNKGYYVSGKTLCKYPPYVKTYKTLYVMNVRNGYSTKSDIITKIKKGTKVTSAYKVGNWIYVPALKGWVCIKGKETYLKEVKSSSKKNSKKKSNTTIAKEVIAGKWGDGENRKKKLEKAGYNYKEIQKKVNELIK